MAFIIGKATDGNVSSQIFNRSQGTITAGYIYTASSGDAVTQLHWRGSTNAAGDAIITLGIYTVTLGLPDILTGSVTTVLVNSAVIQDWDSPIIDIPLSAGVSYCVAWSTPTAYLCRRINEGLNAISQDLTLPLPAIWNQFALLTSTWTCWADGDNTPPAVSIFHPCCAQLIT